METIHETLTALIEQERAAEPDCETALRGRVFELVTTGLPVAAHGTGHRRLLARVPSAWGALPEYVYVWPMERIEYHGGGCKRWSVNIRTAASNVYPQDDGTVAAMSGMSVVTIERDGGIVLWAERRTPPVHTIRNDQIGVSCASDGSNYRPHTVDGSRLIDQLRQEAHKQALALRQARIKRLEDALALLCD